jgi:hypothetical protein
MALYRFLFAPVLLAVAVLVASRDRSAAPPPAPAHVVGASLQASTAVAAPIPAHVRR